MRYNELRNSDIDYIHRVYKESPSRLDAQQKLADKYGIGLRTVRLWAKKLKVIENPEADQMILDAKGKKLIESKYYLFTWAQSKTPVHKGFFNNMKAYAENIGAEIGVIAGRYRNPTSIFNWNDEDPTWDKAVTPYLTLNRHNIHKYLSILSDVKILPTAATPMSGFEGFESEVSIIIGHPRVQMKIVPTLEGYRKKEIFTTGSCTVSDYTDSKAGKKGDFHHALGFVIVEVDGDEFYMRHVTAEDDGSFIDLNMKVANEEITTGNFVELYACGDIHVGELNPVMEEAGRNLMRVLKPKYVRLDDVFNGRSISHHELKDPILLFKRQLDKENLIDSELENVKQYLSWYAEQDFITIMPRNNHDIFLDRYISSGDWKKNIPNALSYMKCASILLEGLAPKGLLPYFINQWYPNIITLGDDESLRISDWEQGIHGDRGANGSRGSVMQYRRMSTKMVTMHTHSPSRYDGVVTGGTHTYLRVGYNRGPSTWMNCDVIIHENGKAQQLIFHNYKCTTLLQ